MQLIRRSHWCISLLLALTGSAMAANPARTMSNRVQETIRSEDTIESLRPPLAALSKAAANLRLPDARARDVFTDNVDVVDLSSAPEPGREPLLDLGFERGRWAPRKSAERVAREHLNLWSEFLSAVDFFHHVNFYNIRGGFESDAIYHTDTGFKGLAQLKSGSLRSFQGRLSLDWAGSTELAGGEEETVWRIARFATKSLDFADGPEPLFADVGDLAFSPEDQKRFLQSVRDEQIINAVLAIRSGEMEMDEFLAMGALVAETGNFAGGGVGATQALVVDIDRDGYDDFYVTSRGLPSLFFRNKRDGTFEEISEQLGLDINGVVGGAFGDFDNDGDADLFISHLNRPGATRYLANEEGRFVDRTDTLGVKLPNWTLSISVGDYNNDGLLDVYLGRLVGTMGPMLANDRVKEKTGKYSDRLIFMDPEESSEIMRKSREDGHPISNLYGASNWLLENNGKGFRRAENLGGEFGDGRSFASAWTDFDLDGDMDLYVVNEIGPNELLRNNGDGTFTDVSNAVTSEIGFGMGAGVGDYDKDGRPDLYTTNMFSKAGLRVAELMSSSQSVAQSARGNTLMRNAAGGFQKVSALDESGIQVEAADFGWGGDFADFDNDGNLDIYVPAGAVTMPAEVATIGDS